MGRASRGKWERRESQGQRPEGCTCDAVYRGGWRTRIEYLIPSPSCPVHVAPLGLEFKQQGEGYGTVSRTSVSMTPKTQIGRAFWDEYAKQWISDPVTEQAKGAEVVHPWDALLDYRDEESGGLTTADVPEMMWCEGCESLIPRGQVIKGDFHIEVGMAEASYHAIPGASYHAVPGTNCGPVVEP